MFLFELLNLSQGFRKYFDITPAVADNLQDEAYGVRHRVYCEELGFEPVRGDHRERDEYDERAVHVLVKSVKFDRCGLRADRARRSGGSPEPPAGREDLRAYDRAGARAKRLGLETLFVLTEPRLANHFARLGVKIRQIGGPVEHRGERVPSMMSVTAIEANLPRPVRPLYEMISEAMRSGVEAQNPGLAH